MYMKQINGSTASLHSTLLDNRYSNGGGRGESNGMSWMLIMALLFGLIAMETWLTDGQTDDLIATPIPIEQKYNFETLEACNTKLNELKTQHKLISLRCVPHGISN